MHHTLQDFDFMLPERLIAQRPARPRDHARLLVYERLTGQIIDDYFYGINKYLHTETTLAVNNSKVEKCRLRFGSTEVFVIETINPTTLKALVRPGKKFKRSASVELGGTIFRTVDIDEAGIRTLQLNKPLGDSSLEPYRLTPLPPYIIQDETLASEYQTIYANPIGSKAAPTAGLHFTPALLDAIKQSHAVAEITLHVGLGTFAPVKSEDLSRHVMHEEWYEITSKAAEVLDKAGHITAVGTTSVRTIESAQHPFRAETGTTDIFITPGYRFKKTDALVTNFHLPKSTLLMLVAAFIGSVDELHRIYQHAVDTGYRFYSFGDAMLIV